MGRLLPFQKRLPIKPQVASPTDILQHWLGYHSQQIKNRKSPPKAILIAFISENEIDFDLGGELTFEDLLAVDSSVSELYRCLRWGRDYDPETILAKRKERKEKAEQEQVQFECDYPFICGIGGCKRRFRTERGLKIHQRHENYYHRKAKESSE